MDVQFDLLYSFYYCFLFEKHLVLKVTSLLKPIYCRSKGTYFEYWCGSNPLEI